jgi:alpha-beta hydrolase superfamily lysophospholipase/NAD kinase
VAGSELETLEGSEGEVSVRRWDAPQPRYLALLAHGYGEHGRRYEHVAAALVADGAVVYAPDHLGHGRSAGERVELADVEHVVDDLHGVVELARAAHPGLAVVLIGHSMGGLLAIRYAQRHSGALAGLVISAPSIGLGSALEGLLALPEIPDVPIDPTVLSRDDAVGEAYAADPLVWHGPYKRVTLEAFGRAFAAIDAGPGFGALPVLYVHGEADELVPMALAQPVVRRLAGSDFTELTYPGARHEVFNETNRDEVIGEVVRFAERVVSSAGQPGVRSDGGRGGLERIGLMLHPTRQLEETLEDIGAWAEGHGVELVQVEAHWPTRREFPTAPAASCDVVLALGGDGTTLAALHTGAQASRPVMGVARGSLGVLTSVPASRVCEALDHVEAGRYRLGSLPALSIEAAKGVRLRAINDLAVLRRGPGQVITSVRADGVLYGRFAGDGAVVATRVGSSGYTMAGGGPLLGPGAEGMVLTPLASHGGNVPPLVVGKAARLELEIRVGHGAAGLELDGRPVDLLPEALEVSLEPDYASMIHLPDAEPLLTGLRRRRLIEDAPRVRAEDDRVAAARAAALVTGVEPPPPG